PYPSRLNDQKLHEKATNQMEKFFQIFHDLHLDISFVDALLLMPKFASTIMSLLTNKDKLFELAKVPLNENCSAMLFKKLPEKLGDPDKFLIPCDFPRIDVCHALADLGTSINHMPLSIWKKLSLHELTPTRMTLELADRSVTRPKGVAKDVFIKVGKFHFPTDFVVVDFEADPRVPLILGRSFLRIGRALIDVYREEITLRINDESEFVQDVLDFQYNSKSSNPTLVSNPSFSEKTKSECSKEPIVKSSSPTLTPFGKNPQDQEKTTFTCPYGTFTYLRMPFGLCNAPGHKISKSGIEVDRAKVDVIAKLPHMTIVKGVRSFLGHAGFYRRFIQDFSKIARPMTHLLEKETPFVFSKDCIDAFETLKKKLTEAPILVVPDWNLPFELMCDASDFAIGSENLAADHLSRLENPHKDVLENKDINENFPLETLESLSSGSTSWAIISDHGTHFCNDQFARVMTKYGVTHCLATAYHPQTSGKVEVSNRGLKRILERMVGENRASWSDKLDDALWAFCTAFKTLIGCTPYKLTAGDHRKLQLNELHDQAYEDSLIYKERTKKLHDSKIKNRIFNVAEESKAKSSIEEPPELELKELSSHLEYDFLEDSNKLPVIIAKNLKDDEIEALINVLKSHKRAIAWKISDIKVIKLLDADMIYPISDSPWVRPIHCVPKKGGMTIVANENNELIPTRLVTRWRVCIDYRKLNDANRKDHFPIPFIDQMLERLAGNEFYCFIDGFSRYFQIPIDPQDQEKTTFTCPYGTFAYRRMPFGLCNALGYKISKSGIEVDRAKVDVIAKLPHPTTIKGVRSFLEKETPFVFSKKCIDAFDTLKKKLTEAPILVVPDWNLPFKLMCDASDYVIGAVLGQRKSKHFQPIHYASKTMTEAQIHYTTTEKEILAVVYAFEKFWPYLVLSKSIVYTDHSALKYFLNKQDAKPSDRETHFCNDQFTRVMIKYGVTHRLATAYHPQTSGQVEVSNHGLKRILERTVGENCASCTIKLSQPNGLNFKVNGHCVKHCFGGDIPSNVASDLHTFPMDN
nr:hypothetical protein [Tanacetum cinerariifolium]